MAPKNLLIEEKLTQQQWSPDQISGRLAKDGVAFISHERIYQHVWKDKKDGGTLYLHLRHSGKKYNRRKGKNSGRGLIPNRVDIDQRPPIVAAKIRIGDWEADTIIGANHKGVVMSHVERTSKYTKLAKLPDKNADSVVQACARVLLPLADQIETITYDNGKEFASHAQIATSLGAIYLFESATGKLVKRISGLPNVTHESRLLAGWPLSGGGTWSRRMVCAFLTATGSGPKFSATRITALISTGSHLPPTAGSPREL